MLDNQPDQRQPTRRIEPPLAPQPELVQTTLPGLEELTAPPCPPGSKALSPEIEKASQRIKYTARELIRHALHPKIIFKRYVELFSFLRSSDKSVRIEVEQKNNLKCVRGYLMASLAKCYGLGICSAYAGASVLSHSIQKLCESPRVGMLSASLLDYAICTSVFTACWLSRHRKFYFQAGESEASKERRKFLGKIIRSDFAVSAFIYGTSFIASNILLAAAEVLPSMSNLSNYASIFTATLNFGLFAIFAVGNITSFSGSLSRDYQEYIRKKAIKSLGLGTSSKNQH